MYLEVMCPEDMPLVYSPLEDACEEDSEPREELLDIDNVDADKTFSWDSNIVTLLVKSNFNSHSLSLLDSGYCDNLDCDNSF